MLTKTDYELTLDFLDMMKERGLRSSLLIAYDDNGFTIHVHLGNVEMHFDFDNRSRLITIWGDND